MAKGKKQIDSSLCPKCKSKHEGTAPSRPTLCKSCQAEAQERKVKQAAQKAQEAAQKAQEAAQKRLPNKDPLPLKAFRKQKDSHSGDVIVRTSEGYYFLPREDGLLSIAQFIYLLVSLVTLFSDWGGVAALFLQLPNKKYIRKPRKLKKGGPAWIFSYTPVNKLGDLDKMWESASAAGFEGMIITTQKGVNEKSKPLPDQIGKHQLLAAILKLWEGPGPDYYEDTASVLDNLVAEDGGSKANNFWVRPKNKAFRDLVPKDDSITWIEHEEFLEKVLA